MTLHNVSAHFLLTDSYALEGFKVLLDVMDKFSCVGDESNLYISDVQHFLKQRKHLRDMGAVSRVNSGMTFMKVWCSVRSLFVNLHQIREDSISRKPVAKLDMQFVFSASLVNEALTSLDLKFSSAALYSLSDSTMLARCSVNGSTMIVLDICYSKSGVGDELCITLPSLDIYLHFSWWAEVINLCNTSTHKMAKTAHIDVTSKCSATCKMDPVNTMTMTVPQSDIPISSIRTHRLPEGIKQGSGIFILKSENIGITFHLPMFSHEAALIEPWMAEIQGGNVHNGSSNPKEESKSVAITIKSRSSELQVAGRNAKLTATLEKITGNVTTCNKLSVDSWPFFQILQVNVETEICSDQTEFVHAKLLVECDKFDAWLSHRVLFFWRGVVFDIPETESTQLALPCTDLKIQLRKISLLISDGRVCPKSCQNLVQSIIFYKWIVVEYNPLLLIPYHALFTF